MKVLVTGASSGIGASISNALLDLNFDVTGIARTKDHPSSLDKRVNYESVDISDSVKLNYFLERLTETEKLDILILNAATTGRYQHFRDLKLSEAKRLFDVNFFPNIQILSRLEELLANKASVIVISSNTLKFFGSSHNMPYAASKAALESATLVAAKTYAGPPYFFRINLIRPGLIDSGLSKRTKGYSAEAFSNRSSMVPVGRVGQSCDIVNVVKFLVNPESDFIIGQTFTIAGGE